MTTSEEDMTERSSTGVIGDWPGLRRRPLLKALGVGTALSLGNGVVTAHEDDEDDDDQSNDGQADDNGETDDDDTEPRPPHLDSYYGFATPDAEEVPGYLDPDHEVKLHTNLPEDFMTDPDRPPFFHFEPSGLSVESGDIVQFSLEAPDHTITAYHPETGFQRRVPDGVPPFSSPVLNVGGAWVYQFDHEGVYDLYCGPHHVLGMNMRIVVGELAEEDIPDYVDTFEGSQDPPLLAPFSKEFLEHDLNAPSDHNEDCEWTFLTPQEILGAPSLDPATIQDQGTVSFEEVLADIDRFPDELPEHEHAVTVQVHEHDEHGSILVGPHEMTLYMFEKDTQGEGSSTCRGDCAEAWPPLTTDDEPSAGDGVEAELTMFEREDGATQVAANGWPLYYFAQDEEPGDTQGQGVNDVWWVLGPDGTPIRPE